MRDHKKLRAFTLADEVVLMIYRITYDFPKEEMYGLTSQMRRAAVSVASNIVEGCARKTQPDYIRFLEIALGSQRELNYQDSVANRLGYVKQEISKESEDKLHEAEIVLSYLIRALGKP